jgi:hypothetical protein
MYLLVHVWKVKPAWRALSAKKRREFTAQVNEGVAHTIAEGAELVGFAANDAETPHRADYDFIATWRLPERNGALELEEAMAQVGWHTYFEQIEARGEVVEPAALLERIAKL